MVFWILVALALGQATPASDADLLALVRAGKATEAWAQWDRRPASPAKLRTGIGLATAAQDVSRGVQIYEQLVAATAQPEVASLKAITLTAAAALASGFDAGLKFDACGVLLAADPTTKGCQEVVQAAITSAGSPDLEARRMFGLANAGYRPLPDRLNPDRPDVSARTKVTIADDNTRLSPDERLALLRAVVMGNTDPATRSAAFSTLATIRSGGATALLTQVMQTPLDVNSRISASVALASQGDPAARDFLEQARSSLVGPRMIEVSTALTLSGSRYGSSPEATLAATPAEQRPRIAWLMASRYPDEARSALMGLLTDPAPAVRASASRVAGLMRLGLDPAVYRGLSDRDPAVRMSAVHAVLQTIDALRPAGQGPS